MKWYAVESRCQLEPRSLGRSHGSQNPPGFNNVKSNIVPDERPKTSISRLHSVEEYIVTVVKT